MSARTRRRGRASRIAPPETQEEITPPVWPGLTGGAFRPLNEQAVAEVNEADLHLLESPGLSQAAPSMIEKVCAEGGTFTEEQRSFAEADIVLFANLCHNCCGCYYPCQYTAPHEYNLNLPAALAEVRRDSWETFVWPRPLAHRFHTHGGAIALALVIGFAVLFWLISAVGGEGEGFYAALSHGAMVALFLPAFFCPF